MSINKALEDCLESVDGPRTEKNLKHKFINIMVIAIPATISEADTWNDMEDYKGLPEVGTVHFHRSRG